MRTLGSFALRVVTWSVLLAALAVLVVTLVVPRVAGATPYAVLTGSMRPDLPPGTLVVVRPVDPTSIGVGDVITYQLESGEPAVVTHRVVAVKQRLDGERLLRTRGDANPIADQGLVRPEQVRGELWYAVPWVGRMYGLLDQGTRQLAVMGIALGLVAYAALMFAGSWRDRRRRARPVAPAAPADADSPAPAPAGTAS